MTGNGEKEEIEIIPKVWGGAGKRTTERECDTKS